MNSSMEYGELVAGMSRVLTCTGIRRLHIKGSDHYNYCVSLDLNDRIPALKIR